jgi:hypothetical protein
MPCCDVSFRKFKNYVIPENFLFTPQGGGKENLSGIPFVFLLA